METLGPDAGTKKGPALGLFRDSKFPTCHRPMHAEDVIVLFTDGLIEEEGQNDEIFSQERLGETIEDLATLPTKELLAKILEAIRWFSGRQEFSAQQTTLLVSIALRKVLPRKIVVTSHSARRVNPRPPLIIR